jgi:hypothetical protein
MNEITQLKNKIAELEQRLDARDRQQVQLPLDVASVNVVNSVIIEEESPGIDETVTIVDDSGSTHTLTFEEGLLTAYTVI